MLPSDLKRVGERKPLLGEVDVGVLAFAVLVLLVVLDYLGAFR